MEEPRSSGITGPQIQISARGPQDLFVSFPAEISFNQPPLILRHYAYGKDIRRHDFDRTTYFGRSNAVILDKCGDLVGPMHVRIVLPALLSPSDTRASAYEWVPRVGRAMLARCTLKIGDDVMNDHERLYMDFMDKCRTPPSKRGALDAMLGQSPMSVSASHEIIVPLYFFNCSQDSRQYFPALRAHLSPIKVELNVESLRNLIRVKPGAQGNVTEAFPETATVITELWAEHFLLTAPERQVLLKDTQPMLVETVYDVEAVDKDMDTARQNSQSSIDGKDFPGALKYVMLGVYRTRDASEGLYFQYIQNAFEYVKLYHNATEDNMCSLLKCTTQARLDYGLVCDDDGIALITYALRPFDAAQPSGSMAIDAVNTYNILIKWSDIVVKHPDAFTAKAFGVVWRRIWFRNGTCSLSSA